MKYFEYSDKMPIPDKAQGTFRHQRTSAKRIWSDFLAGTYEKKPQYKPETLSV